MKQSNNSSPDVRRHRRDAGAYLSVSGNRLLLSLASIVLLSVVMIYVLFYVVCADVSEHLLSMGQFQYDHTGYVTAYFVFLGYVWLTLLFTLFLMLPLLCGLFYMALRIVLGRETVLADLFCFFSSPSRYWRAIHLSIRTFVRLLLLVHVIMLTYEYSIALSAGRVWIVLVGAFAILCEIVLTLLHSATGFFGWYVALAYPSMPMNEVHQRAREMLRAYKSAPYRYVIDFLPWLLLSFATAGILLIADTLPRMTVSYFLYCGDAEQRFFQSEDIKDHE